MAGIGFELKKVFKDKNLINIFGGFTSALFVTSGPMITSIVQLIILDKILKSFGVSLSDREVIKSTILYAYIYSMIISSGFVMVISRFIADKIFINDTKEVLSSVMGVLTLVLIVSSLVFLLVYIRSSLTTLQKYFSYMLFIELTSLYILMAYISAIKNFKRVLFSFLIGAVTTLLLTFTFLQIGYNPITSTMASLCIGSIVNLIIVLVSVIEYFVDLTDEPFVFLPYFKDQSKLFFINLFYTLGMFIHNILFWYYSDLSVTVKNSFTYAPIYDTASFFAVLTTIPAAIIFIVRFETNFYVKYRKFCNIMIKGGSLRDLLKSKTEMIEVLKQEFTFIMQIQLVITVVLTVLGAYIILPIFANEPKTIEIFSFLTIGYYMSYMSFLSIIILIYFDFQMEALKISTIFLVSTALLTLITIKLGENFYGIGYSLASIITFITSFYFINKEMRYIDYRLFTR